MLEAIPAFLAAIETGSIQGAARELNVSRPTIRRRLEILEEHVGVALVTRETGALRPTVAGELFARRAREMMEEFDGLSRAAREAGATPHGILRVGVPSGTPPQIVADMAGAVGAMWPDVTLEVLCSTSDDDLVRSVDCRFALELDPPQGAVVSIELGTVRESLVASRDYLQRHPEIETVEDLSEHPVFVWVAPDTGTPSRLPTVDGHAATFEPKMATNDLRTLILLANDGRGISFLPFDPALAQQPGLGAENLVTVLPQLVGRDRPRRLVAAKAVADTPVVAAFLEQSRMVAEMLFSD